MNAIQLTEARMIGSSGSGGRVYAADKEIAIALDGGPGLAAVP